MNLANRPQKSACWWHAKMTSTSLTLIKSNHKIPLNFQKYFKIDNRPSPILVSDPSLRLGQKNDLDRRRVERGMNYLHFNKIHSYWDITQNEWMRFTECFGRQDDDYYRRIFINIKEEWFLGALANTSSLRLKKNMDVTKKNEFFSYECLQIS